MYFATVFYFSTSCVISALRPDSHQSYIRGWVLGPCWKWHTVLMTTVICFCVSLVWHNVKVIKLSHVWQFMVLDLYTTDLCITFISNNTVTIFNIAVILFCAIILQYSNLNLLPFLHIVYCQWLPTLFISGFVAYIATCHSLFHVLYWHTAITVCIWLLTCAEIFVMVWICRQFIWGKDWNW